MSGTCVLNFDPARRSAWCRLPERMQPMIGSLGYGLSGGLVFYFGQRVPSIGAAGTDAAGYAVAC